MKKLLSLLTFTGLALTASASTIDVTTLRTAGPFKVQQPLLIDSLNAAQKKYSADALLDTPLSLDMAKSANTVSSGTSTGTTSTGNNGSATTGTSLMLAGFSFTTTSYVNTEVKVNGPRLYKIFINGKLQSGKQGLQPGQYDAIIKYVADTTDLKVTLDVDNEKGITVLNDTKQGKRAFTLADNMLMKRYSGLQVSPSGKYALVGTSWFNTEGKTEHRTIIIDAVSGKTIRELSGWVTWMPKSDKFYYSKKVNGKTQLIAEDPVTCNETILYDDMPEGGYTVSPNEDYAIIQTTVEGPKKEDGVYEIINPDDRQPGWRNRGSLSKITFSNGLVQPLTYSDKNLWLNDISDDGKYIIIGEQDQDLTKRPTELMSVYRMNVETLATDKIIDRQGFLSEFSLIPGTNKLAVVGSAEAFDGIGRNLPDSLTPNIYEHQLFLVDMDTRQAEPVSCDFIPSIDKLYAKQSNVLYFTAENADSVSLYRLDVSTKKITMVKQPAEVIEKVSIAKAGNVMMFTGCGACVSSRLYTMNMKSGKITEVGYLNKERMDKIEIGTCQGWRFKSKNGYELTGHVYLPANMDKSGKYPMIVHYYGGCSPTSRRFGGGSHYPAHYWNALGYVVLIVNPSGAAGFGQEWGARHVNTAGEGVAEDIIEATEWYADNNPFVNKKKIGCVSASYGGFMTQLLLEKTDLFACGISHAGISDHTSYWGEGYWGYSYSEVSMANSYPWTRKDLYVDRSTLFHADKVKAPLLFTHGTADTNVPIGESIQMYTALKLLGIPTAFVMVEGENHGIMDYTKRQKWINTMVAWFQRYLKDDPSWWNAIYTPKDL